MLPLSDPKAMLTFVLESLPDRVKVYPTENYYYFNFYSQGVRYAGNLRLDMMDRDKGKLHFAYFEDLQEWKAEAPLTYNVFDQADGVLVEKIDYLVYRVTFREKQVVFELNDLSKVVPPAHVIGVDEKYLGPVFDDSGMRFFLVFNPALKVFHYILDETVRIPDQFRQSALTNRILIGVRTGFAYYLDLRMNRKILIGVFEANSRVNNSFDGPFDQLPDNFVKDDELRDAILAVEPSSHREDRPGRGLFRWVRPLPGRAVCDVPKRESALPVPLLRHRQGRSGRALLPVLRGKSGVRWRSGAAPAGRAAAGAQASEREEEAQDEVRERPPTNGAMPARGRRLPIPKREPPASMEAGGRA